MSRPQGSACLGPTLLVPTLPCGLWGGLCPRLFGLKAAFASTTRKTAGACLPRVTVLCSVNLPFT